METFFSPHCLSVRGSQAGLFCLALFTAACLFPNVMYDGNARYSLAKMMIIYLNKLKGV